MGDEDTGLNHHHERSFPGLVSSFITASAPIISSPVSHSHLTSFTLVGSPSVWFGSLRSPHPLRGPRRVNEVSEEWARGEV